MRARLAGLQQQLEEREAEVERLQVRRRLVLHMLHALNALRLC